MQVPSLKNCEHEISNLTKCLKGEKILLKALRAHLVKLERGAR
jgi:hypothetical protein